MNEELLQQISKEVTLRNINIKLNTARSLIEIGLNKAEIFFISTLIGRKCIELLPHEAYEIYRIEQERKISFCYEQEKFKSNYRFTKLDRFSYGFDDFGLPDDTKALMKAF
jgi:hypothetical protein